MRVERFADRRAELDADPRDRVRIVDIEPEYEDARQADHAHEAHGGGDADAADRPEIGDDFRDPALPQLPGDRVLAAAAMHAVQHRAQRIDQIEQRRDLMADLVHERRRDAAADHALARHAHDRNRILAAAGHARARAPDRGADGAGGGAGDRRRPDTTG